LEIGNRKSSKRRKTMKPSLSLAFGLTLFVVGCGLSQRPFVPTHYYSIDLQPPAPSPAAKPVDCLLAVRAFDAASRYRERILYRKAGPAAGYHEYDRWVEPPAEMVTAAFRRAMGAAGVARVVADERLLRRSDLVLDGRVTRFDEVQGDPQWAADCEIELVLRQAEDNTVLLATRLAANRPAKEKTTVSFVEAMNANVAELAAKATDAVAKALAAYAARPRPKP
jgi:ABC-type uncharacterized transport system auxiliary subunit